MRTQLLRRVVLSVFIVFIALTAGSAAAQEITNEHNASALVSELRQLEAVAENSIGVIGGGLLLGVGIGVFLGATGTYVYWSKKL